jgi:rhamnose utilization protein RhaD (predicted bifunctional aldolase and dehydrogenase)
LKSLWTDRDAQRCVDRYAPAVGEDVALRVYTARLIGAERRLVLHGGGNTSVKTAATTLFGETVAVLRVKGSGCDLATLEPEGLPAMQLEPLRRWRCCCTRSCPTSSSTTRTPTRCSS